MRVAGFFVLFVVVIVIGLPVAGADERVGLAEARSEQNERRRVIAPPGPKPVGPYSPGILADDFLYVSGQGGRDAEGKLPATIEGQVRQTLQNVKVIVEAAGLTMEHVVYSQVYLDRHGALRRDGPRMEGVLSQSSRPRARCSACTDCRPTSRSRSMPSRFVTVHARS